MCYLGEHIHIKGAELCIKLYLAKKLLIFPHQIVGKTNTLQPPIPALRARSCVSAAWNAQTPGVRFLRLAEAGWGFLAWFDGGRLMVYGMS